MKTQNENLDREINEMIENEREYIKNVIGNSKIASFYVDFDTAFESMKKEAFNYIFESYENYCSQGLEDSELEEVYSSEFLNDYMCLEVVQVIIKDIEDYVELLYI